ncbi:helix-turn-helix domain-containing protein [Paenarthrobacter sp. NPDC089989]|uniref:helix-turn-helix domain-containing protein n=1 Tax=unclassified Paenarthrobacter TaxID=2634190 RepID=UPI0037F1D1B0
MEYENNDNRLQGWLRALAAIGAAVNTSVSLKELLDTVARTACQLMSYDFCAVTLPDENASSLLIRGSHGLSAEYIHRVNTSHPIPLLPGPTMAPSSGAFLSGESVQVTDTRTSPAFATWAGVARDQGFISTISVPLVSAGKVVGTLNCYTKAEHVFAEDEVSLLRMLADQAAIAIITSRLRAAQAMTISDLNRLNESLEEQFDLQRQAVEIHTRLTALTLEGGGVPAVADALAQLLGRPVVVQSATGSLMYSAESGGEHLGALLIDAGTGDYSAVLDVPPEPGPADAPYGLRGAVRAPVLIKDEVVAWIWTSGETGTLRALDRRAIEQTCTVLALELLRSRAAAEASWRDSGEILSALLAGVRHGTAALLSQAGRLGHDLSRQHAVFVLKPDPTRGGPKPHQLPWLFERLADKHEPRPLLGLHDGYIVALLPLTGGSLNGTETFARMMRETFHMRGQHDNNMVMAVAGPALGMPDYPEIFSMARGAVELAAMRGLGGKTLTLEDLGMAGLFLQLPDVTKLSAYVDRIVGPLRHRDLAEGTALLPTLRVLLASDLDMRETAERMFVHRNTVNKRRKRIEEILGIELSSVEALAHLVAALSVEDVMEAGTR